METLSKSFGLHCSVCVKRDLEEQVLETVFFRRRTSLRYYYRAAELRTNC